MKFSEVNPGQFFKIDGRKDIFLALEQRGGHNCVNTTTWLPIMFFDQDNIEIVDPIADLIHATLMRQDFADWYNPGGQFDDYISDGDHLEITKEMILKKIAQLFKTRLTK